MTDDPTDTRPKLELSGVQLLGGALAATTSAVAASALGVAGTLAGAAVGSAVATIGASLYTYSLRRTSQTVKTAVRRTPGGTVVETTTGASPGPAAPRLERRAALRWAPVGAAAAAFALAIGGVSAAELVAGEPLATAVYGQPASSGTTVGAVMPDEPDEPDQPEVGTAPGTPEASPSPEAVPSETPDGEKLTAEPTGPDGEPAEDAEHTRTERVEVAPNRDPSSPPKGPAADAVPPASPTAR